MEFDEEYILSQLKKGHIPAFEQAFYKYYKPLVIAAMYLVEDEVEAEDLVQSFFIDFYEKKYYLNVTDSLKMYFFKAVKNRSLNLLNSRKLMQKNIADYNYIFRIVKEDNDEPGAFPKYAMVKESINRLPPRQNIALNLVYFENLKYKEAADKMGISINSFKTHLKLALKSLRSKFRSVFNDEIQ